VITGRTGGYVQSELRGHPGLVSRTYYDHGHYRAAVYRDYNYRGYHYYGYYHPYGYHPAFYRWAYDRWPGPVYWSIGAWGWGGPWWDFYYGWWVPNQYYASANFWLTDYLIAANLQAAYGDVGAVAGGPQITVPGNQPWTDSGIFVNAGQQIAINASGGVSMAAGAAPLPPAGPPGGPVYDARAIAPNLPCYSLLGKIGLSGVPFYIGSSKAFGAPGGGELFLGVNDGYFPDNSGAWFVTVNQGGAPAPATPPAEGGAGGTTAGGLTREVKEAIAEEVKAQLQAEQAAAGQSGQSALAGGGPAPAGGEVPPALDPAHTTFIVNTDLAVEADGQECSLTQGDVLSRIDDTPNDGKVTVRVSGSKKTDCATGKKVAVSVDDLQEMYNDFQQQLDEGMKTLAAKQGTGGLPKAPDTSTVASNVPPPEPDKSDSKALEDQEKAADQTEAEVRQAAGPRGGGSQ
jgi:hypothetical protein